MAHLGHTTLSRQYFVMAAEVIGCPLYDGIVSGKEMSGIFFYLTKTCETLLDVNI